MYDILTFGASIDELNTEAIQQAIDAAASDGGGTVVVPAGEFLTGALFLKSNVELHKAGVDVSEGILTTEELVNALCQ